MNISSPNLIHWLILPSLFLLSGCSLPEITINNTYQPITNWENLQDGLKMEKITADNKHFLIFSIDPKLYSLSIVENNSDPDQRQSIEEIHKTHSSVLSFNGGFFSKDFQPTGLIISQSKGVYPLVKAKLLNGIFWIDQDKTPHLSSYQDLKKSAGFTPEFAIQSGPILINEQGQVTLSEKDSSPNKSSRTAIGIDKDNQIIVIFLKQTLLDNSNSLSLYEFSKIISTNSELKNYQIHSLLNLDGGTSAGLATDQEYFPELEKVQNIIITQKRV